MILLSVALLVASLRVEGQQTAIDGPRYTNGTTLVRPTNYREAGEAVARCVECHTKQTAVERTFVQFYPTLLEVARQKGTLKPGF